MDDDWHLLFNSTISSALNAMSLVALEDIIKKRVNLTDLEATKVSKLIGQYKKACYSNA